jgi:hypothetical protein
MALLDVNLHDALSFPVASLLQTQCVPFLFVTGYDKSVMPPAFRDVPVLQKPLNPNEVLIAAARYFVSNVARIDSGAGMRAELRITREEPRARKGRLF